MSDLGCGTTVTGEFEATTTKCGSRGVIKHIGHKVDDTFLTLFDVCYDNNVGETLYTEHLLHGSAISCKYQYKRILFLFYIFTNVHNEVFK